MYGCVWQLLLNEHDDDDADDGADDDDDDDDEVKWCTFINLVTRELCLPVQVLLCS